MRRAYRNIDAQFVVGIGDPFSSIPVSHGDDPQEGTADGERNEEISPLICPPKRVVSSFPLRVLGIAANYERIIEEDVFGFFGCGSMPLPVVFAISPSICLSYHFEPGDLVICAHG
jgi:hypothetical protein